MREVAEQVGLYKIVTGMCEHIHAQQKSCRYKCFFHKNEELKINNNPSDPEECYYLYGLAGLLTYPGKATFPSFRTVV